VKMSISKALLGAATAMAVGLLAGGPKAALALEQANGRGLNGSNLNGISLANGAEANGVRLSNGLVLINGLSFSNGAEANGLQLSNGLVLTNGAAPAGLQRLFFDLGSVVVVGIEKEPQPK